MRRVRHPVHGHTCRGRCFDDGPAGGLTPGDLATAYGLSSTATGTGQVVAIVDWGDDPTIAGDLNTFDAQYGLAACTTTNGCFKKLDQSGAASPLPTDQGTSAEIALDVESVHSVCQKCIIDLIEVNNNSFASTEAGVNKAVALGRRRSVTHMVVPTHQRPGTADIAAYNHPGVVITVSSVTTGTTGSIPGSTPRRVARLQIRVLRTSGRAGDSGVGRGYVPVPEPGRNSPVPDGME